MKGLTRELRRIVSIRNMNSYGHYIYPVKLEEDDIMGRYGCYCKEYSDEVEIGFEAGSIYMALSHFLKEFAAKKGYPNVADAILLYMADWIAGMVKEEETKNLEAIMARLELALKPAGYILINKKEFQKGAEIVFRVLTERHTMPSTQITYLGKLVLENKKIKEYTFYYIKTVEMEK